jgi:hypothetical protein
VRVKVSKLKNVIRVAGHNFEFERLEPSDDYPSFKCGAGAASGGVKRGFSREVRCDPCSILIELSNRAKQAGRSSLVEFRSKQALARAFEKLIEKAGIPNSEPGREHKCYTLHSCRVGGTCTLLKAGLEPKVISALAMWTSEQIDRYGVMVMCMPSLVCPFQFFNPRELAGAYGRGDAGGSGSGSSGDAEPARKRIKRG